MKYALALTASVLFAGPAFADAHLAASGDAAAGEGEFRQCQACHVVQNVDGETLAGRASKTGPNLYGVVGRTAGSVEDYDYSDLMLAAGEAGMIYDEANFVAYVMDPTGHLKEVTGENRGRGKMSYRVRGEEDAINLYAFLAQFGDAPMADEAAEEAPADNN